MKHFCTRIYDIIALSSQCLVLINASNYVLGGGYGSIMKLTMYVAGDDSKKHDMLVFKSCMIVPLYSADVLKCKCLIF